MTKVLIAEDDIYLREAYTTILTTAGYEVDAVENGREALRVIERSFPDLLLLDMLMPIMGGIELLGELSSNSMRDKLKVVAFTNLSDKDTIEKLQTFGVEKYLLKSSVMPAELVATIKEIANEGASS